MGENIPESIYSIMSLFLKLKKQNETNTVKDSYLFDKTIRNKGWGDYI